MPDEALFCEHCGKERQLVPDYEAELNQSMDETISTIAVELANTQEIVPQDLARDAAIKEQLEIEKTKQEKEKKNKAYKPAPGIHSFSGVRLPFILLLISMVVVLTITGIMSYAMQKSKVSTYEYQIEQAKLSESSGDYEAMLEYARKATEIAANSSDARMLMARAYGGLMRIDEERIVLEGLVITDPAYTDAYSILIPMYEASGEYEKIASLLLNCPEQSVIDKYAKYIASPPEFSVPGGQYFEPISLKLLATGSGKIYYTVDGSAPDTKSSVYTTPLMLENGKYKIRAIYENSFGIISSESSGEYEIQIEDETVTFEVSLPSGSYNTPQVVRIETEDDAYQVYYTSDGSEPGLESRMYKKPIPLPLGSSDFSFVMYDEDGNASEVVSCHYQFDMELALSSQQVVNLLSQALVTAGVLEDNQGTVPGGNGVRSYEVISVIESGGGYFYLLEESFVPSGGAREKTGNFYAVSPETGKSYNASENADGSFSLGEL